jgi:hypothetical protein
MDETADIIMRLRGRTSVAGPEWLTSGVVPEPGVSGDEPCTSRRPSPRWEAPSRPRMGWALAVYGTVSRVMVGFLPAVGPMAPRIMEISVPARSNMPPWAPKSFCVSTTSTAVLAVSMAIGFGVASILTTWPFLS